MFHRHTSESFSPPKICTKKVVFSPRGSAGVATLIMSEGTKCHFRGVIFCGVVWAFPFHKREILLPPGAFRVAFQENDTCFAVDTWARQINIRGNQMAHA